jgi:hypothetical protein
VSEYRWGPRLKRWISSFNVLHHRWWWRWLCSALAQLVVLVAVVAHGMEHLYAGGTGIAGQGNAGGTGGGPSTGRAGGGGGGCWGCRK